MNIDQIAAEAASVIAGTLNLTEHQQPGLKRIIKSAIEKEQSEDTKRLDWLDETQALCDDGDGTPFYQEWKVTAPENYRGIRAAIDAAMRKDKK